jgi:hypothetical protein
MEFLSLETITGLIINYEADKLYSSSIDKVFQVWNFVEKNGIYKFEQKGTFLYYLLIQILFYV